MEEIGLNNFKKHYIQNSERKDDSIIYFIKVLPESTDFNKNMDEGLLIALIDTYSTIGSIILLDEFQITVSIYIKMTSFGTLKENETYKMEVKVLRYIHKDILLQINILDSKNKLIKNAFHLKRIIKAKF